MNKSAGLVLILFFFLESFQSCQEKEREALLNFRKGVRDSSNRLSSWVGEDCCKWKGVGCENRTGHVISLDLRNPLPYDNERGIYRNGNRDITYEEASLTVIEVNPSLVQLQHLNYLDLSWNNFSGIDIPSFFGSFKKLIYLNLSCASFGGIVPHHLGNLSSLRTLDLRIDSDVVYYQVPKLRVDTFHWTSHMFSLEHLDMTGIDLSSVPVASFSSNLLELHLSGCGLGTNDFFHSDQNLSSLLLLAASNNQFEEIPNAVWNMTSLRALDLSQNIFSSSLSAIDEMKNLQNLETLDLSDNNFQSLPSWSYQLKKLKFLDFSRNPVHDHQLSPITFRSFPNLKELHLNQIGLTGSIPTCLGKLPSLEVISLRDNELNGIIPTWLAGLPLLSVIDLSSNQLKGLIPASLGRLTALRKLDLSSNQMIGSIPESIGRLPMLSELRLGNNQLSGPIPMSLGTLSHLTILDFQFNQLNGPILLLLDKWPNLTTLYLGSNKFNGSVPETLGHLSNLVNLDLSLNLFTGTLSEVHFAKLSKLKSLALSSNFLSVKVPFSWVPPFQLTVINLASCHLGPRFPNWIRTQTTVMLLYMGDAGISDTIPNWFHNLPPSLLWIDFPLNQIRGTVPNFVVSPGPPVYLFLRSNKFTGPFPPSLSNVAFLDLSGNSIVGPIPQNIGDMLPDLSYLSISNNHIYGNIPKSLCKLEQLTFLDLANNSLSGYLPQCWRNFQQLLVVDVTSNSLSGTIPSSICLPPGLRSLRLSNNSFYGALSSGFKHCSDLTILDIGENNLSGEIPAWIGESLPSLEILKLRLNQFNGSISPNLCHLNKLRILDVALNNISGNIPHCFGQFNGMIFNQTGELENVDTSKVYTDRLSQVMKGRELEYMRTLPFLVNMDLSSNNFFGQMPQALTSLTGLIGLNLSNNHLTGNIPDGIGKMRSLESLDLSRNDISGMIPQSISSLSSLSLLNLSNNHLSGSIPTGHQLQTFNDPSIYGGNPELCGSPLVKKCLGDEPPRVPWYIDNKGNEEEDDLSKTWLWIGIVSGSVVGFWGFLCGLYFKKTWRCAYFQYIEDINDKMLLAVAISTIRVKKAFKHSED